MRKIIKRSNYKDHEFRKEVLNPISLTVPDQEITIREILEKYTRGIDLGIAQNVYYGEDENDYDSVNPDEFKSMDPVDQTDLINKVKDMNEYRKMNLEKFISKHKKKDKEKPTETENKDVSD